MLAEDEEFGAEDDPLGVIWQTEPDCTFVQLCALHSVEALWSKLTPAVFHLITEIVQAVQKIHREVVNLNV